VAKTDGAHKLLAQQFEQRTVHKEYLALVSGVPERDSDYIERTIGFHPTNREKMAIRLPEDGGKEAVTFYEVLERFRGYAFLRCKPATGRTHQIRVHLAHIGHPIVSDKAYSGRDRLTLGDLIGPGASEADAATVLIDRQALHAASLRLDHPLTRQPLHLTAPLPDDMIRTLEALRRYRRDPDQRRI
jgi:23S rRNA pseudouridine1911/1915/1917 synthase